MWWQCSHSSGPIPENQFRVLPPYLSCCLLLFLSFLPRLSLSRDGSFPELYVWSGPVLSPWTVTASNHDLCSCLPNLYTPPCFWILVISVFQLLPSESSVSTSESAHTKCKFPSSSNAFLCNLYFCQGHHLPHIFWVQKSWHNFLSLNFFFLIIE